MLDKYIGDALMAVFGTPVTSASDADRALAVAIEMMGELARFNERRREGGLEPIEIGVGMASGEVVAGSLGSRRRLEYTVIGDNVNLAARLESANKYYGTHVLLSGSTADALSSRMASAARPNPGKGQIAADDGLRVVGHHTAESFPKLPVVIAAYEAGLSFISTATGMVPERFGDALIAPAIAHRLIDRCRYYRCHPPSEN